MFPIMNHSGKTVGFTGRVRPEFEATEVMGKYVNSPETPIFSKSRVLYGFNKTKGDIREAKEAVIVEGQMDMLAAWQDGVKNVAASSGTALTREHITAIARMADKIILNFDSDEAGMLAGERAIDLALKADLGVKVLVIKGYKDTAEMAAAEPGKLTRILAEEARPAMEFYFRRYLGEEGISGRDPFLLKKGVRSSLSRIKALPSAVERDFWLRELARKTGVAETALAEEMKIVGEGGVEKKNIFSGNGVAAENGAREAALTSGGLTRMELISEKLLGAAIYGGVIEEAREAADLMPDNFRKIFEIISRDKAETGAEPEIKRLLDLVYLRSGLSEGESISEIKKQLKIEVLKRRKNEFLEKIKIIERRKEGGEVLEGAMKGLLSVSAELNEILK